VSQVNLNKNKDIIIKYTWNKIIFFWPYKYCRGHNRLKLRPFYIEKYKHIKKLHYRLHRSSCPRKKKKDPMKETQRKRKIYSKSGSKSD